MSEYAKQGSFYEDRVERSYGWVLVAALASIAIHFLLFRRVADMRFDVAADIPEKYRETPARKVANFEHLKQDPIEPLPTLDAGDPESTPGVGVSSEELSEIVSAPVMTFSAPPASQAVLEAATVKELQVSEIAPEDSVWQPRQEIVKVVERIVRDDVALLPRREIFSVERVADAPDYAPAVDLARTVTIPVAARPAPPVKPQEIASAGTVEDAPKKPVESIPETITAEALKPEVSLQKFAEKPGEITKSKPIDTRLRHEVSVFSPPTPDGRKYFKIDVDTSDASVLPVVPKDIVIVQDASNSLAEKRLQFCRVGIVNALKYIAPADRFNIASFREDTVFCFEKWASPTPENIAKATAFVQAMKSQGDTDIFESLKKLMALPRDSRRPLVVIVITDGKATTGLTSSTDIIGEFSKLNDNMSLFVVGTKPRANDYLLNMLSFCNRGEQTIVTQDRIGIDTAIPRAIEEMVVRCSYPVLGRIGVTAGMAAGADFYPYPPPNLYAGRKLTFYGSCPSNVKEIVMQVRGEGGGAKCDCLFTVDLEHAASGGGDIRTTWADRKMHDLIGRYARERTPAARKAIFDFAAATGMPVPFRGSF